MFYTIKYEKKPSEVAYSSKIEESSSNTQMVENLDSFFNVSYTWYKSLSKDKLPLWVTMEAEKQTKYLKITQEAPEKSKKNAFLRQFSTRINHVAWVSPHLEVKQYIFMHSDSIKFIYSEKATKFCNKRHLISEIRNPSNIFVAILENQCLHKFVLRLSRSRSFSIIGLAI